MSYRKLIPHSFTQTILFFCARFYYYIYFRGKFKFKINIKKNHQIQTINQKKIKVISNIIMSIKKQPRSPSELNKKEVKYSPPSANSNIKSPTQIIKNATKSPRNIKISPNNGETAQINSPANIIKKNKSPGTVLKGLIRSPNNSLKKLMKSSPNISKAQGLSPTHLSKIQTRSPTNASKGQCKSPLRLWKEKYSKTLLLQKKSMNDDNESDCSKEESKSKVKISPKKKDAAKKKNEKFLLKQDIETALHDYDALNLTIEDFPEIKALKVKLIKSEKFQKSCIEFLESNEVNYNKLRNLVQAVQSNGVLFDEAATLIEIAKVNSRLKRLCTKKQTIEELKNCIENAIELGDTIDYEIIENLNKKLINFQSFIEKTSDYFANFSMEYLDKISIQTLLKEAQDIYYEGPEVNKLENVTITFSWFKKLTKLCKFYIDMETCDLMEIEITIGDLEDDTKYSIEMTFSEMYKMTVEFLKEHEIGSEAEVSLFKKLYSEIVNEEFLISNKVKEIYILLSVFILRHQIRFDQKNGSIKLSTLTSCKIQSPQDFLVLGESDLAYTFSQVQEAQEWCMKIEEAKDNVMNLLKKKSHKKEEIQKIKIELQNLKNQSGEFCSFSDLDEFVQELNKYLLLSGVLSKISDLNFSTTKDGFSQIRSALNELKKYKLDGTVRGKYLKDCLERFSDIHKKLSRLASAKQNADTPIKFQLQEIYDTKFYSAISQKIRIQEIIELINELKKSESCDSDLEEWEMELFKFEEWTKDLSKLIKTYSFENISQLIKNFDEFAIENIFSSLIELKERACRFCFMDQKHVKNLQDFEVMICGISVVTDNELFTKNVIKTSYADLLNTIKLLKDNANTSPKLIEELDGTIRKAKELGLQIGSIKSWIGNKKTKGKTWEDFLRLKNQIDTCRILIPKDRTYIDELYQKLFNYKLQVEDMVDACTHGSGNKNISIQEIKQLQEEISQLPIKLETEEAKLNEIISKAYHLENKIKQAKKNNNIDDVAVNNLEKEYDSINFEIPDMKDFLNEFHQSKTSLDDISIQFENMQENDFDGPEENLKMLVEFLKKIYRMNGSAHHDLWYQILIKAVDILKDMEKRDVGAPLIPVDFIKIILDNYLSITNEGSYGLSLQLRENQGYLKEMIVEIEKEIAKKSKLETVEKNLCTFKNVVSYYNEVIEKRKSRGIDDSKKNKVEQKLKESQSSSKMNMEIETSISDKKIKKIDIEKPKKFDMLQNTTTQMIDGYKPKSFLTSMQESKIQNAAQLKETPLAKKNSLLDSEKSKSTGLTSNEFESDKKNSKLKIMESIKLKLPSSSAKEVSHSYDNSNEIPPEMFKAYQDRMKSVFRHHRHIQFQDREMYKWCQTIEKEVLDIVSKKDKKKKKYEQIMEEVLSTLSLTKLFNMVSKSLRDKGFCFNELQNYFKVNIADLKAINSNMWFEQQKKKENEVNDNDINYKIDKNSSLKKVPKSRSSSMIQENVRTQFSEDEELANMSDLSSDSDHISELKGVVATNSHVSADLSNNPIKSPPSIDFPPSNIYYNIFQGRMIYGTELELQDCHINSVNSISYLKQIDGPSSPLIIRTGVAYEELENQISLYSHAKMNSLYQIVMGWFETTNPETVEAFNTILKKMVSNNTIGVFIFSSGCKLYVLPKIMLKGEWTEIMNIKYVASEPTDILVGLIIAKNNGKSSGMNPIPLKILPSQRLYKICVDDNCLKEEAVQIEAPQTKQTNQYKGGYKVASFNIAKTESPLSSEIKEEPLNKQNLKNENITSPSDTQQFDNSALLKQVHNYLADDIGTPSEGDNVGTSKIKNDLRNEFQQNYFTSNYNRNSMPKPRNLPSEDLIGPRRTMGSYGREGVYNNHKNFRGENFNNSFNDQHHNYNNRFNNYSMNRGNQQIIDDKNKNRITNTNNMRSLAKRTINYDLIETQNFENGLIKKKPMKSDEILARKPFLSVLNTHLNVMGDNIKSKELSQEKSVVLTEAADQNLTQTFDVQ